MLNNVYRLKKEFANFLGKQYFKSLDVDLGDLLIYFGDEMGDKRLVLVLDEF